ncbi:MAG: hypothetical protein O3A40_08540 [Bacteroidetes bacterium]|nr:hypothetical protein [Bacteroidota bacterium]
MQFLRFKDLLYGTVQKFVICVATQDRTIQYSEHSTADGKLTIGVDGWEISANLSAADLPALDIKSTSGSTVFSAYGNTRTFGKKTYPPKIAGSSVLFELVKGKNHYTEVGDDPLPRVR